MYPLILGILFSICTFCLLTIAKFEDRYFVYDVQIKALHLQVMELRKFHPDFDVDYSSTFKSGE